MSSAQELVQLLSALISVDNKVRSEAEASLNGDWSAGRPDHLLAGLSDQVKTAGDPALRSFACVLLRKIAPKESVDAQGASTDTTVWGCVSEATHVYVKNTLISAFGIEEIASVRHKLADVLAEITQLEGEWPEFGSALLQCTQASSASFRESAFRVFGTNPELLGSDYSDVLRHTFVSGLQDTEQSVQIAAVQAFSTFIISSSQDVRNRVQDLIPMLMNVLPPLLHKKDSEALTFSLNALTDVVETFPKLFQSMFPDLLNFCLTTIRDKDLDNQTRQASLEVLVLFAENAPGMCRKDSNYTSAVVVECLSLMTDLGDDDDTAEWLSTEDLDADESDANHVAGEQALDRLARKLGGKTILPACFTWLPKLLASNNWQERHAALMALSSIAEGCEKIMRSELAKVLAMVLPSLSDVHPRVRWAACNAVGQMCTDFSGDVQKQYTAKVLNQLTPILDTPESRVAAHAAAAFVNFCENADQASLEPFLDPILERLLNLLQRPQRYIQEQAVTTIATVADAAEQKFVKYYDAIMPLLLNVLREANGDEHRLLRGKAMECATLVALAVGKEVFAPQSQALIQTLGAIQNSVLSADDPQASYLMASWGRLCKVMGADFYPYLEAVMPPILKAAKLQPDFTVVHDDTEKEAFSEEDGWEFFPLRGQQVGIKTSTLEDKNSAVSILVLYAQEMKAQFHPYAAEVLRDIALPGLVFYYHDGVRSASAQLMPELLNCVKLANPQNSEALGKVWNLIGTKLLDLIKAESSIEMLGELYQAFYESVEVIGKDSLGPSHLDSFITSTESQLADYGRRAQARAQDHKAGDIDLEQDEDVLYEIELDEELLSEISKTLHVLFKLFKAQFMPYWQRLLPMIQKFTESADASCRQWSICLYDDLIEFCGPDSWSLKDQFLRPLASGLMDTSAEVRQAAAYGIGCAAQHGGEVFADLVSQSLPTLFSLTEHPECRTEDNVYATENACVSIAKICRFNPSKVANLDDVIAAWIRTMPVTHDEQDAPYAYRYLGELMDSKHAAIVSQLEHVIDVVAQAVVTSVITGQTLTHLLGSTKTLLGQLPQEASTKLIEALEPERRLALTKHFV